MDSRSLVPRFFAVFCLLCLSATTNAGWEEVVIPIESSGDIAAIDFLDNNNGWALAPGSFDWELFRTTDGGTTWTSISEGEERAGSSPGFAFFSETNGWMWFGDSFGEPLLRTTDGGVTWNPIPVPLGTFDENTITMAYFLDDQTGWIAGDGEDEEGNKYNLARTFDSGQTWEFVDTPLSLDISYISMADPQRILVADPNGQFLTSQDGGATWNFPRYNDIDGIYSILLESGTSMGWIGGEKGLMLSSSDAGLSWTRGAPPIAGQIEAIHRASDGRLFVGGSDYAWGFLYTVAPGSNAWFLNNIPFFRSQSSLIPNAIKCFGERPDGTIFAGGRTLLRLAPDSPPVFRLVQDKDPYTQLPPGIIDVPWAYQFEVSGGSEPLSYSAENLPSGLALDSATGILSGTVSSARSFTFTVTVTDADDRTDMLQEVKLFIAPAPPMLVTASIAPFVHRTTNRQALPFNGGNAPYNWQVKAGALPKGVTVEGQGILAGTPQETGSFDFTLEVVDSSAIPQTSSASFSITVDPLQEDLWEIQQAHNRITFVHVFDENEALAGGWSAALFRTTDGGRTWSVEPRSETFGEEILNADWVGDTGLLSAGNQSIFRSTDRGRTWAKVADTGNSTIFSFAPLVHFHSENLALSYSSSIAYSNDGGITWQASTGPFADNSRYWDLDMATDQVGWATGSDLTFLRTDDGGKTWNPDTIDGLHGEGPSTVDLLGVAAVGQSVWVSTTLVEGFGFSFFRSLDGGQTWDEKQLGPRTGFLTDVTFLEDGLHGWVTGINRSEILRTSDGGDSWQSTGLWLNGASPMAVSFLDADTGFIVFNSDAPTVDGAVANRQGSIWRTNDGGQNAVPAYSMPLRDDVTDLAGSGFTDQYPGAHLGAISFATASHGFAMAQTPFGANANPGQLLVTDNGGATWRGTDIIPGNKIVFASANRGYIYREGSGWIWETTDGGQSWTYRPDFLYQLEDEEDAIGFGSYYDIFFIDELHGWVATRTQIFRTVNGGQTWTRTESSSDSAEYDIEFLDRSNGWRLDRSSGRVAITSDGGMTWTPVTPVESRFRNRPTALAIADMSTAFIVSEGGTIYQTSDGGQNWITVQYDGEPTPFFTGIDTSFCTSAYAIGYYPRVEESTVGRPFIARADDSDFSDMPQTFFGLNNHGLQTFATFDSVNAWGGGTYGAGLKFAAASDAFFITTEELATGSEGASYNATLDTANGQGTVTWSVCSGLLPPGIDLSTAGTLTGTATEAGGFRFVLVAEDSASNRSARRFDIMINPVNTPEIQTSGELPPGTVFQAYGSELLASGSQAPYLWRVVDGEVPPGLEVFSSGAVVGVPTQSGTFTFTLEVTDAQLPPARVRETFTVNIEGLTILPPKRIDPTGLLVH